MPPPTFGVDTEPKEGATRMAYIARAACGHIVIASADTRPSSLQDFIAMGVHGLLVERVPSQQVRDEFAQQGDGCYVCQPPDQLEAFA
jgi:hypothetical protein